MEIWNEGQRWRLLNLRTGKEGKRREDMRKALLDPQKSTAKMAGRQTPTIDLPIQRYWSSHTPATVCSVLSTSVPRSGNFTKRDPPLFPCTRPPNGGGAEGARLNLQRLQFLYIIYTSPIHSRFPLIHLLGIAPKYCIDALLFDTQFSQ